MRIDSKKLKALFRGYVQTRTPSSRLGCPPPEKMIAFLRSEASKGEATEIVDHISNCSSCLREFEFAAEVLRREGDFIREVEHRLSGSAGAREKKRERDARSRVRPVWRSLFPRLSWHAAVLLAGSLLIVFLVSRLVVFRPVERYRAVPAARVELLEPVEKTVSISSLVFRWKEVREAEYYSVELFNEALSPLWKSGKIVENAAVLPQALTGTLEVNRSYFWMVTAYLSGGEKIVSRLEEFSLKE
jgi:hypothetical protein